MHVLILGALGLTLAAGPEAPAALKAGDWVPLVQSRAFEKARTLCEGWLARGDDAAKVEAHKCLANVELGAHDHALRVAGDAGGGFIGASYDEEPALRALAHLDAALALAPGDLSVHQARLHVLLLAGMLDRLVPALEESDRLYRGADALDAWIPYSAQLFERRELKTAEAFLLALEKGHPGDHRVAGNLAAVYGTLERDREALAWAQKAVKLAPRDPTDAWNLARIYDFMGRTGEADAAYRQALGLMGADLKATSSCVYAAFVAEKRKERRRACELQKASACEPTACAP